MGRRKNDFFTVQGHNGAARRFLLDGRAIMSSVCRNVTLVEISCSLRTCSVMIDATFIVAYRARLATNHNGPVLHLPSYARFIRKVGMYGKCLTLRVLRRSDLCFHSNQSSVLKPHLMKDPLRPIIIIFWDVSLPKQTNEGSPYLERTSCSERMNKSSTD
jgi:hypothetical protein